MDAPGETHSTRSSLSRRRGTATLKTLRPQTEALNEVFSRGHYETIVFTGCGSTYYLSLAAAALLPRTGRRSGLGHPGLGDLAAPREARCRDHGRTLLVADQPFGGDHGDGARLPGIPRGDTGRPSDHPFLLSRSPNGRPWAG